MQGPLTYLGLTTVSFFSFQIRLLLCAQLRCLCTQVPFIIGDPGLPEGTKFNPSVKDPGLANVAPTLRKHALQDHKQSDRGS